MIDSAPAQLSGPRAGHLEVGGVRFVGEQEVFGLDVAVHHSKRVQVRHLAGG